MSGRFRLDPRAPSPERAPPPLPQPKASGAPVPPLAPRPAPLAPKPAAAAAPARRNRRALVLGAVVVALLLVGGGVAIFAATALGYPDKYVLESREMPRGMSNARLTQTEMEEIGITSNPGELDRESREEFFETNDGRAADRAHAQVLSTSSGDRVVVLVGQYDNEEDALAAAREARALCSFAGASALRDGKVLVVILSEGASRGAITDVRDALKEKTRDLVTVCG